MKLLSAAERLAYPARLFGSYFPLEIEPNIYNMAGRLSADYNGGYWEMFDLEPGFLMVPPEGQYRVIAENGARVTLGEEAFGLTVCLYTYSLLSFRLEACIPRKSGTDPQKPGQIYFWKGREGDRFEICPRPYFSYPRIIRRRRLPTPSTKIPRPNSPSLIGRWW